MANALPANMILNRELLDRKLGKDTQNTGDANEIVNKSDLAGWTGVTYTLSSHLTDKMGVSNGSIERTMRLKFGTTRAEALNATAKYYIFINTAWDGTTIQTPSAVSTCKFYQPSGTSTVGSGYLINDTTSTNKSYYRTDSSGSIVEIGSFNVVYPSATWYYSVEGATGTSHQTLFDSNTGTNERAVYQYNSKWYNEWTYIAPDGTTGLATKVCVRYIHSNAYEYRIFSNGSITTSARTFRNNPSTNLQHTSGSAGASGGTLTFSLTFDSACQNTQWKAVLSGSTSGCSITQGSSGTGNATIKVSVGSASSSRSITLTVTPLIENVEITTYRKSVTYTQTVKSKLYVKYEKSENKVYVKASNQTTTTNTPIQLQVTITGTDERRDWQSNTITIPANQSNAIVTWQSIQALPDAFISVTGSVNPSSTELYDFAFIDIIY